MPESSMTEELFAALVWQLLKAFSTADWLVDSESFSLRSSDGSSQISLSLASLFQSYISTDSPANIMELQARLRAFLLPAEESNANSAVLSSLRPSVRSNMAVRNESVRAHNTGSLEPGDDFVFFPYADVLSVSVVFSGSEGIRPVRYSDLDRLSLSPEEAVDIAVHNLYRVSLDTFRVVQSGFYTSPWKDSFDGSRLLLTDLFYNLKVEGEVVALTPTPDTLLITGSKDLVGIELMMSIAATLIKEKNAIRALPLVLRDGIWTSFVVPTTDPIFDTVHSYRMNVLNLLYSEQESFLVAKKMEKPKIFVSPFVLETDRSTGRVYSRTVITDSSGCMFPECDVVEFFQHNNAGKKYLAARAPFKKVYEQLYLFLIEDPNLRPRRFRLNNFPRRSELTVLGTMPIGQCLESAAGRAEPKSDLEQLEAIVRIPIPKGAQLTFTSDAKNKESVLEFSVSSTIDELKEFYLKHLRVGNLVKVPTDAGQFWIAEVIGAACAREAWIGPGQFDGVTLLRLIKRVSFNTPAVNNAFIKQSEGLRLFEQLFGISLLEKMRPIGDLNVSKESMLQEFLMPDLPEAAVRFFRTQLSGPRTTYFAADKTSPHTVVNMEAGLMVTISPDTTRSGTHCSVSKSLQSTS
ncbi:MAG: hypothetical protein K2X93_09160 [Candidatus Obscuribacterales bacterium]|nr:hypothetical protein [Candidatus Obscuribacterales bacterium]